MGGGGGLSGSRWASPSHRNTQGNHSSSFHTHSYTTNGESSIHRTLPASTQPPNLSRAQKDLLGRHFYALKFTKLTRRLKWKSRSLSYSYYRVLNEKQYNVVNDRLFPMEEHEAETMFKIDFFEYYVLLERVLVSLLGMLGMVITAAHGSDIKPDADGRRTGHNNNNGQASANGPRLLRDELMARSRLGDSTAFFGYEHRFHANVLAALDREDNPLHEVLGTGPVRDYLGIAKEFRNRWKDADEKAANGDDDGLVGSRYEQLLKELNLEVLLGSILEAIENAAPIVKNHLYSFESTVDRSPALDDAMTGLTDDNGNAPPEATDDLMDWD